MTNVTKLPNLKALRLSQTKKDIMEATLGVGDKDALECLAEIMAWIAFAQLKFEVNLHKVLEDAIETVNKNTLILKKCPETDKFMRDLLGDAWDDR